MTFGEAIELLKKGHFVSRRLWKGKNELQWLCLTQAGPLMDLLVILLFTQGETLVPVGTEAPFVDSIPAFPTCVLWEPRQADILADDWIYGGGIAA